ncbi:hypothetical protein WG68_13540 [Arsukibacterium ikkense]|uniref:Uncharacterized protein n=1 Tax=Arsukibacterium ikkense TaxID=336831 RepID=A0A0M2V5D2_9GAMM|nr:hypothetical protein WG68_13540 [Arsukibacterium ikkense]
MLISGYFCLPQVLSSALFLNKLNSAVIVPQGSVHFVEIVYSWLKPMPIVIRSNVANRLA